MDTDPTPVGHRGGPPLYGRMMKAISKGHTFGNTIRMVKLPLIFAEPELYAGAIAQFFWLSETLETVLARHADHAMVAKVRDELGLCVTPGYVHDLQQLYGSEWRSVAEREKSAAESDVGLLPKGRGSNRARQMQGGNSTGGS